VEEYAERPEFPSAERLATLGCPVLFLSGERDKFSTPEAIRAIAARLPRAEAVIIEGADHLFFRREREAAAVVGEFAERAAGV